MAVLTEPDTAIRVVHDLTEGAWFGGMLMGAVAIDAATRAVPQDDARIDVADRAWQAWHRVSNPVIVGHLLAGVGMTYTNRARLVGQTGVSTTTVIRALATGSALIAELRARSLGRKIGKAASQPVEGSTTPGPTTDPEIAELQRQLRRTQWTAVACTATLVALGAVMGEQQRPTNVVRGALQRLRAVA